MGQVLFEKHEDGQSFAFLDGKEGDPGSRFITGILSPQLALSDSESSLDDTPFSATGCSDSSFGFTCCVPFSAKTLSVEARVSHYERDSVGGGEQEAKRRGFRRVPAKFEKSIALEAFPSESNEVEWTVHTFGPESDKVLLSLIKRRDIECESGNVYTLSIFHAGKGEGDTGHGIEQPFMLAFMLSAIKISHHCHIQLVFSMRMGSVQTSCTVTYLDTLLAMAAESNSCLEMKSSPPFFQKKMFLCSSIGYRSLKPLV